MESLTSNIRKLPPSSLIWSNISVSSKKNSSGKKEKVSRKLLDNISGIAQSGEIFAIMGASGVGKTTLLRVLSGRLSHQLELNGKVYLNGHETSENQRTHSGLIGHVEQEELFVDTMTLEEHLIFQAMLRMPDNVPDEERKKRVNEIIIQLVLLKSRGTMIARLSGGEKKRLAFATALLTNPNVLLVDEPTSGLDTYLAKSLMNIIRLMAIEKNQTVIVILHQPTDTMFDLIDKIYVIVEGGRPAFFGNKTDAIDFFTNQCDMSSTSLDGFIEQLAAPPDTLTTEDINIQKTAANEYSKSNYFENVQKTIENYTNLNNEKNLNENKLNKIQRGSFFRQLKWLLWRSIAGGRRNPKRTTKLVIRLVVMAIIIGVTFLNLTSAPINYIEKTNSLLAVSFMSLLESNMNLILVEVPTERQLVIWEYRRQLYSIGAYYLTRLIVDTMYNLITAIINMGIIMIFAGLPHWFGIICVMILVLMTACSFAVFIASISSTPRTALLTLQPTQNIFANLIGFYINLESIPMWIRWLKYLSYLYYGYKLLLTVQWANVDINIPCKYFYLNSTYSSSSSSLSSDTCPGIGNEVLNCFDVSSKDYYHDIIALFIMFFGYHILAYFIILLRTKYHR